jgi:hypothetical protein
VAEDEPRRGQGGGGVSIPLDELLHEAQRLAVNLRGRPEESEAIGALQRRLADARRLLLPAAGVAPAAAAAGRGAPPRERRAALAADTTLEDAGTLEAFGPEDRAARPLAADAGRRVSFGDLISEVGNSMADAQRALDRQSLAYLENARQLAPHGLGMPTAYRMPRVKAEFRFALDTEAAQGFNLLFVRDTERVTSSNTQTVEFEIVAAPAAPAPPQQQPGIEAPMAQPVLDPRRRSPLLAAFRRELEEPRVLPDAAEKQDRVLLFAFGTPGAEAFVLGLFRFERGGQRQCALVALVPAAAGEGWKGHFLSEVGEWAHGPGVEPNFARIEQAQQDLLRWLRER